MAKRGPQTETGRIAVRFNAVKHGIQALTPVLDGLEDPREWARHLAGMYESWEPETYQERLFVDRLANLSWRLKRVERFDTDVTLAHLKDSGQWASAVNAFQDMMMRRPRGHTEVTVEQLDDIIPFRLIPDDKVIQRIQRYEAHLHRLQIQTMHELEAMQARRRGHSTPLARLDITGGPE